MLVQTTAPDAPAIEAAARHDTEGFLAGELERREALRYPPFADLIRVVVPAEDGRARARRGGRRWRRRSPARGRRSDVLGPAPLFRLRGRERFQVVRQDHRARGRDRATAAAVEAAARDRALAMSAFSVDVDPQ